jgi:putative redox protein
MPAVTVTHDSGDRFDIAIRGHVVHVDQPEPDGGTDTAPTPTELFVASLASCVAFYARRYLKRHDLPQEGLTVTAQAESGAKPSRVASMTITLTLPEGVPEEKRQALLAVASHCTVHNTLTHPPEVLVQLAD